jgi:hypothetical protein
VHPILTERERKRKIMVSASAKNLSASKYADNPILYILCYLVHIQNCSRMFILRPKTVIPANCFASVNWIEQKLFSLKFTKILIKKLNAINFSELFSNSPEYCRMYHSMSNQQFILYVLFC